MTTVTSAPTLAQLLARAEADLTNEMPDLDPTIARSWARVFVYSSASRALDLYKTQQQYVEQFFPQTAIGKYLKRWGTYEGLNPLASTGSTGPILLTGTVGTLISTGTEYRYQSVIVSTDSDATITQLIGTIVSITRVGTTATVVTSNIHNYATGIAVDISGANETEWNDTFENIVVFDDYTFTFDVPNTFTTPATGTMQSLVNGVVVIASSLEAGATQNVPANAEMPAVTTVPNTDDLAYTQLSGISGGADQETTDAYRDRIMFARANPVNLWNPAQIEAQVLTVNGVTRVYVQPITPRVGQLTVYFFRDNDVDPVPDANEILDVRTVLLAIYPAWNSEDNLFVNDPAVVSQTIDFTFTALVPDTTSMRNAIAANLDQFFIEEVDFEQTITEDSYRAAIQNTVDDTGARVESFTLSAPVGDIVLGAAGMAFLGNITYV